MKLRYAIESDFDFLIEGLETVRTIEQRPAKDIPAGDADRAKYKEAIRRQLIRVVEDAGDPVAYLHFRTDAEVMLIYDPLFWIDLVYVCRDMRGKGLGRMLYEDAIRIARQLGYKRVVLDVFEVNEHSRKFHEKMGFEPLYSICQKWID